MILELELFPDSEKSCIVGRQKGLLQLKILTGCTDAETIPDFSVIKALADGLKIKMRDIKISRSTLTGRRMVDLPDGVIP